MISDYILKDSIQLIDSVSSWEEAIRISTEPLLKGGYIKESYVDAMINGVKEFGPYIVIAPMIAMPHARPECGALKIGISILKLKEPVSFTDDGENQAKILFALSAAESESHIHILSDICTLLSDEEVYQKIINCEDYEELLSLLKVK